MPNIIWKERKRWTLFALPFTFTKYSLSEECLYIQTGLLNWNEDEVKLYRITDLSLKRGLFQRLFGLGTIKCCSADKTLGDFEIKDLDKTVANKKTVRRFLTEIFQNGELEQWSDYVAEDLIQHNHEIGQGSQAYKNYVAEHDLTFDFVFQLLGQGNYVVSYGQTQIDGVAYAQYDIFRLENGLIVEHWDNKEVMPKVEDLTNRGKF